MEGEQKRLEVLDAEQKLLEAQAQAHEHPRGRQGGPGRHRAEAREGAASSSTRRGASCAALKMLAPSDGVVSLLPNWRSGNWNNPQDFKEGDRAWPGAGIAELPDASSLYVSARVDEVERGRMKLGHAGTVRVEARAGPRAQGAHRQHQRAGKGRLHARGRRPATSTCASRSTTRTPRLRPGMTATVRVAVERVPNVLLVPAEAVFTSAGEDVVYVAGARAAPSGGRSSSSGATPTTP